VGPTEADPWAPLEAVAIAAVAAAVLDVLVAVFVVVGVANAGAAVAVAVEALAAAGPQELGSYVGAYDLVATGHFWVMFGAPHQERCYSVLQHVVAAWITAVASVAP